MSIVQSRFDAFLSIFVKCCKYQSEWVSLGSFKAFSTYLFLLRRQFSIGVLELVSTHTFKEQARESTYAYYSQNQ
jgi:hypothetical protein